MTKLNWLYRVVKSTVVFSLDIHIIFKFIAVRLLAFFNKKQFVHFIRMKYVAQNHFSICIPSISFRALQIHCQVVCLSKEEGYVICSHDVVTEVGFACRHKVQQNSLQEHALYTRRLINFDMIVQCTVFNMKNPSFVHG